MCSTPCLLVANVGCNRIPHLRILLRISDTSKLSVRYPTLNLEQEAAYLAGAPKAIKCSPEEFYIDFARQWAGSKAFPINRRSRHIIIRTFQRKAEGETFMNNPPPPHMLTDKAIGAVTDTYMKSLRHAYRKGLKPTTKERKEELMRLAARTSRTNTVSSISSRPTYTCSWCSQLYQS